MQARNRIRLVAPAAMAVAALAPLSRGQQTAIITGDTFIDSGSPGTYNPQTGDLNVPGSIVNGQDIYSYGDDGKVKAVTSSYSSSYPFVSATHVLLQLPQTFWSAIGSGPVSSVIVNYYPFNDSLSVPDQHDNMELHPLTRGFTIGNGTQSPLAPSTTGGATWDSYDGAQTDAWTTPGGDFDMADYVLASVTDSTLPPSKGSVPFSWDITSLINNPTTRAELENYGALIKVINEGVFPNNPPPPNGENDFVSFYSADYQAQMGTTDPSHLPTVVFSLAGYTWNNASGDQQWNTFSTNWNNGSSNSTYVQGGNVTFNDANGGAGNYAVTLNTIVSPASVAVNNTTGNYSITGTGSIAGTGYLAKSGKSTLRLGTVNTYTGGTSVSGGTLVVGAGGALGSGPLSIAASTVQLGSSTGLSQVTSLSIVDDGKLDINNNHLIINYGNGADPISSIAALLTSGYANGAWNGIGGIVSSAAAANPGYALGYADAADPGNPAHLASGTIEIAYTLQGDADLNGIVNGIDFGIVAANFNQGVSGWDQGDFDYNHIVNGVDFGQLAVNFNKGASGASAGDWAALDAFAAANGLLADVPEPITGGILSVAVLGAMLRRRRRSN